MCPRLVVLCAVLACLASTSPAKIGRRPPPMASHNAISHQYSVHDLQHMRYVFKVSNDIDVDICKASGFYGDIAQPMFAHPYIQHYFYQPTGADATAAAKRRPTNASAPIAESATQIATTTNRRRRRTKAAKQRRRQQRAGTDSKSSRRGRKSLTARTKRVTKVQRSAKWRRSIVESTNANDGSSSSSTSTTMDTEMEIIMRHSERATTTSKRTTDTEDEIANERPGASRRRHRRAAIAKRENLWEHAVIPYEIESNFTGDQRALFKQAMQHWENHTCIRFIERDSAGSVNRQLGHDNYVLFTVRPCGCCSYVGRRGNGPQAISIGRNCDTFGVVVHEIGHAVGFFHEHTRPDRDQHVRVLTENIAYGRSNNFQRMPDEQIDSLGQPYDFESIMHYADNQLARAPGLRTLELLNGADAQQFGAEIGQRRSLSVGDIVQANLLYRCAVCGHTLLESRGAFAVPAAAAAGGKPLACEWRIVATAGERIVLRVSELRLGADCELNYVEVRDGYWSGAPVIARLCGGDDSEPAELQSTGNRMLITLRTQAKATASTAAPVPFAASYETICGGDLFVNETSGRIESPNYPSNYLPDRECVWRLSVPAANQVALQFQSFDIEAHTDCALDALEIRDGAGADAPLLGRYCGFRMPAPVHSTGAHLWVRFRSDRSTERAGFSATILRERDECALGEHSCQHGCVNTAGSYRCTCADGFDLHSNEQTCETSCGRVIELDDETATTGTIVSPSFPDLYPSNKECVWEIRAPAARRITLNFTHFDLEDYAFQSRDCDADSLAIDSLGADGDVDTAHGVHCGSRRFETVLSSTGRLRLVFRSDRTIQKGGFALIYALDVDECAAANNGGCMHECRNTIGSFRCSCGPGTVLHANGLDCVQQGVDCRYEIAAPAGRVASPNWPLAYPPDAHCRWHFRTVPGHRVQFQFEQFDVEPADEACDYDRVSFYDGGGANPFALGVFCGRRRSLPTVQSSTGDLVMEFSSDASGQRAGFEGAHSTVCGGRFMASDRPQRIYSHVAWPSEAYGGRQNCEWVLMAPEYGQVLRLSFEEFEVGAEGTCADEFVEVIDGENDFDGEQRGRYCGGRVPPTQVSSAEVMMLRFVADVERGSRGFVMTYVAVDAVAGNFL